FVAAARASHDPQRLHDALAKAASTSQDPERSVALWREAVNVAEAHLAEPQLAIADLRSLLDVDETATAAWSKLITLLSASGNHRQLADALRRRVGLTEDADERHELSYRLANLLVDKLDEPEDAIAVYNDMIVARPQDLTASHELEVLLRRMERWADVYDLLERKLDQLDADRRIGALEELAGIAERQLDDPSTAIGLFQRILREVGDAPGAEAALERLLRGEGRFSDLVDLLEVRMHRLDAAGETGAKRETASELAKILAESVGDGGRASQILDDILAEDPSYVPAILALATVHEARGDDAGVQAALERAVALNPEGPVGADLHIRLAQLADSPSDRREHLERALSLDPANTEVVASLLQISRKQQRWDQVAHLLEIAAGRAVDDVERLALMLERVDVLLDEVGDVDGALRILAGVYEQVQDNLDVNRRIADALFQAGRLDEAADMYAWLLEADAMAKRNKTAAHYLTRLARISHATGDAAGAVDRLEEAYRVDTTNVETLIVLGDLHEQGERWQDALKIYRSMLLQNADRSGLLGRGDIYLRLASAHIGLGERPKAAAMLRRGLEEDPGHAGIAQELDRLGA
ncbi:MAG: tetratricopeptide repeat protein, partial [Myxococcales bacterium FL481]